MQNQHSSHRAVAGGQTLDVGPIQRRPAGSIIPGMEAKPTSPTKVRLVVAGAPAGPVRLKRYRLARIAVAPAKAPSLRTA